MTSKISKVGIVGSGFVGQSLGCIFVTRGIAVKFYDALFLTDTECISNVKSGLRQKLKTVSPKVEDLPKLESSFSFSSTLAECVLGSDLVYECVFEDPNVKQKVLLEIDEVAEPHTIITSSTSCIMPSVLSEGMKNREKFLVNHPVNPPFHLRLVEIVPAPWTKPEVVAKVRELMVEVGQKPICLKREVRGFALNRVQYAIINSSWDLVQQGIVSPSDADDLMVYGLGPRYAVIGPFETMHLNAPNGVRDYMVRYEPGMKAVSVDMGQNPSYDKETFEVIAADLESRCPVQNLKDAIVKRDEALKQFKKIKTD